MASTKTKKRTTATARSKAIKASPELDSVYLLKLLLYLIIGSQWIRLQTGGGGTIPLPLGLIVGLTFAMHDHFQIDRKVEYAVLLIAMLIGFFAQTGLLISI
jgi:hypothetical protein